jgi:hypothetical protein
LARLDDYLEDRQDANVDGGILVANHEMILLRDLRFDCDKQLVENLLQACKALVRIVKLYHTEDGGCDHSVGICICAEIREVFAAEDAIAKAKGA